jgi:hypothetical protein
VYNGYLKSLIEFEYLQPKFIIKKFFPYLTIERTLSSMKEFGTTLILASAIVVSILIFSLMYVLPFTRKFGIKKFNEFKTKMFFNGIITSVNATYITYCLVFGNFLQTTIENEEEITTG